MCGQKHCPMQIKITEVDIEALEKVLEANKDVELSSFPSISKSEMIVQDQNVLQSWLILRRAILFINNDFLDKASNELFVAKCFQFRLEIVVD